MRRVHIEEKAIPPDAAVDLVEGTLASNLGAWLSPARVVALTGLPIADAEAALLSLSSRHPSRLGVAEDGTLVVLFKRLADDEALSPLQRLGRWVQAHRDPVMATFTFLSGPLITVFAFCNSWLVSDAPNLDPSLAHGPLSIFYGLGLLVAIYWGFVLLGYALAWLFVTLGFTMLISPAYILFSGGSEWGDRIFTAALAGGTLAYFGYRISRAMVVRVLRIIRGESDHWARNVWRAVGGFVFGPAQPARDALHDERRLVARIRELEGVVTTGDLMGLFGWSHEEAQGQVVRILLDYGGDIVQDDDGSVLWVFPALADALDADAIEAIGDDTLPPRAVEVSTPQAVGPSPGSAYRPEVSPQPAFFGCTRRFAILLPILLIPSVVGPIIHPEIIALPLPGDFWSYQGNPARLEFFRETPGLYQGFGLWPMLILYALLLGRIPGHLSARRRHRQQAVALRWLECACTQPWGSRQPMPDSADTAALAALDAEIEADPMGDPGLVVVRFPAFEKDFAAAARYRAERPRAA